MEKMMVVVFDNEKKAYEGSHALLELDREGSIAIHDESVIQKNSDGSVTVKRSEGIFPLRAVAGTAVGSLIGLLGGPLGFAVGAAAGASVGVVGDLYVVGVNDEFLAEVASALAPGKFAVVADINEEWVTPVDTRMEEIGGIVLRTARQHFEEERQATHVAELRAEITQLKAEQAHVNAERKAKLRAKIDDLNGKLQHQLEKSKQRSQQLKREADAKIQALRKKATAAHGEAKEAFNAYIAEIREQYERAQPKKGADKLPKAG